MTSLRPTGFVGAFNQPALELLRRAYLLSCSDHSSIQEAASNRHRMRYIGYNQSMITTIRKSGNSFVIRVPREEMERAGVQVDEHVLVEIRPIEIRPKLTPRLQAVAEDIVARPGTARAFARLADG